MKGIPGLQPVGGHQHLTSRRRVHRVAWQAKFATYIVDGNLYEFHAPQQKRFGTAA